MAYKFLERRICGDSEEKCIEAKCSHAILHVANKVKGCEGTYCNEKCKKIQPCLLIRSKEEL